MKRFNLLLLLLGVIVVFLVGFILLELKSVLLPFVIAVLISIIIDPVVTSLKRRKVPTAVSLLLVLLSFAVLLLLLSLPIYSSIVALSSALPRYEARLDGLIQGIETSASGITGRFGIALEELKIGDFISVSGITGAAAGIFRSFFAFIGNLFLVLLFMLFILSGSGDLNPKLEKALPAEQAARVASVIQNIGAQVREYLIAKTAVSAGTGLLITVVLWMIGVDFPLFWGFLAFLLNFIPNVGSIVAVLLPVLLSLLQFETLTRPIITLVVLLVVQNVMGNVVEPRLMAERLNLSPLLILVSLIFWGWLWGVWGMLLSVPLTATVKIVFDNIDPLRPVAVLMSGRSPV